MKLKGPNKWLCVTDFHISVGQHLFSTLKLSTVIRIMNAWFHGVGFPQYVYLDSGPQFNAAKFKYYFAKHYITPLVSSACFPKSNVLAKALVKSLKYLLLKSENYSGFEKKLYNMQSPSSQLVLGVRLVTLPLRRDRLCG
jgi:transposase InsO family protein